MKVKETIFGVSQGYREGRAHLCCKGGSINLMNPDGDLSNGGRVWALIFVGLAAQSIDIVSSR